MISAAVTMTIAVLVAQAGHGAPLPGQMGPEQSPRPVLRDAQEPASQPERIAAIEGARIDRVTAQRPRPRAEAAEARVTISSKNTGFHDWIGAFRGRALAQGIDASTFDGAFAQVRYNTDVIQRDRNQSEFTKTIWQYLDSAASDTRIANGRAALERHAELLDRIEARYGVEKEVVAAVWGLESAYGAFRGSTPIIEALATLAYDGRRGRFFEAQLVAALQIVQSGDTVPSGMTGSWAGAMGHTQFIPTSYLAYAVDFTGDGKRDIWSDNPADALASTAAYLARFGWTEGQPWGVEVILPRGFDYALASRKVKRLPSQWEALGIRGADGGPLADHGKASVLLPAGAEGAAFLIFDNFGVIERYNTADAYVIGVGHLSDRLTGAGPIRADWPRGDRALTFAERKEMQALLSRRGHDTQGVDGKIGPLTIEAIRGFQKTAGLVPDGYASLRLLEALR
ncbi:lytic murein transglycosylase [Profundibacterium mesophilum]